MAMTPSEFDARIRAEIATNTALAKAVGHQAELARGRDTSRPFGNR